MFTSTSALLYPCCKIASILILHNLKSVSRKLLDVKLAVMSLILDFLTIFLLSPLVMSIVVKENT